MKMTISAATPAVAAITPARMHRKVLRVASKRLRAAAAASGIPQHHLLHGKGVRGLAHQQSICENSNDSGIGFDHHLEYHPHHAQAHQHPLAATTRRYTSTAPTNTWPLHHNNNNSGNVHNHQVRLAHETAQQFDPSKRRKLIKMESEDANDNYNFQENLNNNFKPTSIIRTAPQSIVPSLSRTGNQTASPVRAVPRCVQLTNRRSPTGPITLTTQLGNVSRSGKAQLQIVCQPEQQHRARYQTEGSRGAVKDRTGNGFPIVKLIGYEKPATLQVFIGTDMGRVAPHMFYQACRVSGKNSTPCIEKKIEGTIVIEVDFDPTKEMMVTCDCVGILKERNVDVEHRFPDQSGPRSKKKSTRCRMVFRTTISNDDGSTETLQTCSQPIVCTQPPGIPEICKKSLTSSPTTGNLELFVLGKNFLKDTRVIFQQVRDDLSGGEREVIWEEIVIPDKEFLQQTHLVCVVPPYVHHDIVEPVPINLLVVSSGKTSEPHLFMYTPSPPSTSSTASYVTGRGPSIGLWSSEIVPKAETDVGMMPPPAPFASFSPLQRRPSAPEQNLKTELLDDSSRGSYADASDSNMTNASDNSIDGTSAMLVRRRSEISVDLHAMHAGDNSVDVSMMRASDNSADVSMMRAGENSVDLNAMHGNDSSADVNIMRVRDNGVPVNLMRVAENSVDINIMRSADDVDVNMMRVANGTPNLMLENDNSVDVNVMRAGDNSVDISMDTRMSLNMIRSSENNVAANLVKPNDNGVDMCDMIRTGGNNIAVNMMRPNNNNVVMSMIRSADNDVDLNLLRAAIPLGLTPVEESRQTCKEIVRSDAALIVNGHGGNVPSTDLHTIGDVSNGPIKSISDPTVADFRPSTETLPLMPDDLKGIDLRTKAPIATVSDLIDTRPPSMATLRQFGVTEASTAPMPAQSAQSVENYLTTIENDKIIGVDDKKILSTIFERSDGTARTTGETLPDIRNGPGIHVTGTDATKALFDDRRHGLMTNGPSAILTDIDVSAASLHATESRHDIVLPPLDTRPIVLYTTRTDPIDRPVLLNDVQAVPSTTIESQIVSEIESSLLGPISVTEKLDDLVNSTVDTHMGSPPLVTAETSPKSSLSAQLSPDNRSPSASRSSISPCNQAVGSQAVSSDIMINTQAPVMEALKPTMSPLKAIGSIDVGADALSPEIILDPQISPSLMCRTNVTQDSMLLSPRGNSNLNDICQAAALSNESSLDMTVNGLSRTTNQNHILNPAKKIAPFVKTLYLGAAANLIGGQQQQQQRPNFQSLLDETRNVESTMIAANHRLSGDGIGMYSSNESVITSPTFSRIPTTVSSLLAAGGDFLNSAEFAQRQQQRPNTAEIETSLSASVREVIADSEASAVSKENVLARQLTSISETDLITYMNPNCFEQNVYPS